MYTYHYCPTGLICHKQIHIISKHSNEDMEYWQYTQKPLLCPFPFKSTHIYWEIERIMHALKRSEKHALKRSEKMSHFYFRMVPRLRASSAVSKGCCSMETIFWDLRQVCVSLCFISWQSRKSDKMLDNFR